MTAHRTHRMEKLARIYDSEILPLWSKPFGRMLLRELELKKGSQILDVACGTGFPATEFVERMPEKARLIAIDNSAAMLDVARKKLGSSSDVFFKTESSLPKLSFADDVYDMVICNLGLVDFPDPKQALKDFSRVTKLGGEIRCTMPLAGTFAEFYDLFREVLMKHDKRAALERLDEHLRVQYPPARTCKRWMEEASIGDATVEVDKFTLLFNTSREFFYAPIIEYGPLASWKAIAGVGQEMQDIFWHIKDAIDNYYEGRSFELTVRAGCLKGKAIVLPDLSDELLEERVVADAATIESMRPVMQDSEERIDAVTRGIERPLHISEGTKPAYLRDSLNASSSHADALMTPPLKL